MRAVALSLQGAGFVPKAPIPEHVEKKERAPSEGSEWREQQRVVRWWDGTRERAGAHIRWKLPSFALYAVPNGGSRGGQEGFWMKLTGTRSGIPDLQLDAPRGQYHGMRIEMKYGRGKESEAQIEVATYLRSAGYFCGTYWNADDAMDAICDYLDGRL